jgi:flagellar hook-length control protein FliK
VPPTLAAQFARELAGAAAAAGGTGSVVVQPAASGSAGPNGPAVILPNAATPVGQAGSPVASALSTVEGAPAKRRGQGDAASQVQGKTPDFVPGLAAPVAQASSVDPSVATAVSQPGLPTPAEQVAMRLVPLRRGPDGVHRLTIHLNPEDLGPISVVAEVRGGAIAVQLHSATEAGRAALQASLADLRQSLIDGGFGSCALDLQQGDPSQGQSQPQPNWNRSEQRPAPAAPAPVELPEIPVVSNSALDLRV